MGLTEFTDAVERLIEQAKKAKIPLQDIIDELEDIKTYLDEELSNREDEDEEKESD